MFEDEPEAYKGLEGIAGEVCVQLRGSSCSDNKRFQNIIDHAQCLAHQINHVCAHVHQEPSYEV